MWPSGQPFRPLAIDAVYSIPVHEDLSAVESYRENFVEVGPFFFPVTSLASISIFFQCELKGVYLFESPVQLR